MKENKIYKAHLIVGPYDFVSEVGVGNNPHKHQVRLAKAAYSLAKMFRDWPVEAVVYDGRKAVYYRKVQWDFVQGKAVTCLFPPKGE